MSNETKPKVGSVGWMDLTVEDAPRVRDFYREVVGLGTSEVEMGGYSDYCMLEHGSERPVAGVCHARGTNAGLPPVWLVYFTVADVDASVARCEALGGRIVVAPKGVGGSGRYAVVEDPAGAVAALYEPAGGVEA